ncbi:CRISPR-associated protein Cas4 [Nanoarchaeota archaeon]
MISVSQLSGYLYCPRKLYLQYVLKLEEPPKEALVLGTVRHACYDGINKIEENVVKSLKPTGFFSDIQTIYKKVHLKILREVVGNNENRILSVNLTNDQVFTQNLHYIMFESRQRALNIYNFIKKEKIFGDELWEKLTPKILSELSVSSKTLGVRGIIDQIEVYHDKKIPVELKTGSAPLSGVWPGHKIQIGTYGLLMEEKFGHPVEEGYITYLDINDRRKIAFNVFLRDEIKDLILKVNDLKKSKDLPPILKSSSKCKSCGLRERCYNESYLKDLCADLN